jgi:hypothetical protein
VLLLFEDSEDAKAALTDVSDGKTRHMTGPVKTWLKIAKNRYGVQGAYLPLKHYKSETRFQTPEEEDNSDGE